MASTIPRLQQAAVLENPGPDARIVLRDDIPVEAPGPGQILIKLSHSGICGSEVRAFIGWGTYDQVIGHEGIGRVVSHGADVPPSILGRRVGVKWLYQSCRQCDSCTRGFHHNCPRQMNTGRSCPGTLQQYIVADPRYVTEIPEAVPGEIAAPLLCAGLTMMGAVGELEGAANKGDWVVILGSGGGLGHIGVQIAARVRGYRVIGVDTGASKRDVSIESGAELFVDYAAEDVEASVKQATGEGAHAVIVVPSAEEAFRAAPGLVRNRGSIVCVGLPADDLDMPIPVMTVVRKALTIKGVLVGSEGQMVELLEQARQGVIRPSVQLVDMAGVGPTIAKLTRNDVSGRIVLAIPE